LAKYVIYENSFGYDDECYSVGGSLIHSMFDDQKEAEETYRKLELDHQKRFVANSLDEQYKVFNSVGGEFKDTVNSFVKGKTGEVMLDKEGRCHNAKPFELLEDDDILTLADMLDSEGYYLVEYQNEPVFYVLKYAQTGNYVETLNSSWDPSGLVFSESRDGLSHALSDAIYEHGGHYSEPFQNHTKASLSELSDSPDLLKKILESNQEVGDVNMRESGINIEYSSGAFCLSVNELLKKPFFEIVHMNIDELKQAENTIFMCNVDDMD